jgi:hypothetical protein
MIEIESQTEIDKEIASIRDGDSVKDIFYNLIRVTETEIYIEIVMVTIRDEDR